MISCGDCYIFGYRFIGYLNNKLLCMITNGILMIIEVRANHWGDKLPLRVFKGYMFPCAWVQRGLFTRIVRGRCYWQFVVVRELINHNGKWQRYWLAFLPIKMENFCKASNELGIICKTWSITLRKYRNQFPNQVTLISPYRIDTKSSWPTSLLYVGMCS